MKNAGGLISARKRKTAYMDETLKLRYTRIVKFFVLLCSEGRDTRSRRSMIVKTIF